MVKRRITALRPPVSRMASEVGALCVMVADPNKPYVRSMRVAKESHVFMFGNDALLMYASIAKAFAGDATFKTVTESNRQVMDGRWYLCNFIASASVDQRNDVNVVVSRSLMTGLSKEACEAVFDCFFAELAEAGDHIRCNNRGTGCIKVCSISPFTCTRVTSDVAPDRSSYEASGVPDRFVFFRPTDFTRLIRSIRVTVQ